MPDRTPLRLVLDELGNPTGLAEFREGDTLPIGFVSGLGVELATIDALLQAVVVDKDLAAPPGSPANGSMYIVAAGATGAWSGQSGKLAYWLTTVAAWTFITPADGWSVWVSDEAKRYERVSGAWVLSTAALGLGTAATATLTVSNTDPTSGRVVKNGDYGLFRYNNSIVSGSDANSYNIPGSRTYVQGGTTTNLPLVETGWIIVDVTGDHVGGERLAQTFIGTSGRRWVRSEVGGVYTVWDLTFTANGTNAITADTGSIGYGTGSGGAVTQATSKATGVTLNKPSGQVTTAGAALAANSAVSFTLTNNKIGANDVPKVVIKSGATAGAYVVQVDAVAAGSCRISIRNMTGGSLSETLVLQFNIEKGAIA